VLQRHVQLGQWISALRRRGPNGNYVPVDDTVRSYHISDWMSQHERASTGELYKEYLLAFEVTSVLLLVAVVGAVVLGKRKESLDAR